MPGQRVEDGPVGRVVEQVVRRVADQAVRRAGDQEPAVGERRAQARTEPPVGQRERARQPVVERQVLLGPVAHGRPCRFGPAGAGRVDHLLGGGHEPATGPVLPLVVGGMPALRRDPYPLPGCVQVVGADPLAAGLGVPHIRFAVAAEREAVAAVAQHTQVVVVRMVLHHQHDNVLDLRQPVAARRPGRIRALPRGRRPRRGTPCAAAHLGPFQPVPHAWRLAPRAFSGVHSPPIYPWRPQSLRRAATVLTPAAVLTPGCRRRPRRRHHRSRRRRHCPGRRPRSPGRRPRRGRAHDRDRGRGHGRREPGTAAAEPRRSG